MTNQVKLSIDSKNLINNALKNAFSGKSSVIKELAQNARRAGASFVSIVFNQDERSITVNDDGKGIGDISDLLSVAKSGWDSGTIDEEKPFGLGFLSCLYSAEEVLVESRGKSIHAFTQDVLAFNPIAIHPCEDKGITIIKLIGGAVEALLSDIDRNAIDLSTLFSGFSIPVYVNGEQIERPYALGGEGCSFIKKSEASIRLVSSESKTVGLNMGATDDWVAFFQGFPIAWGYSDSHSLSRTLHNSSAIVHLNAEHFSAVAPDRSQLIDAAEAYSKIKQLIEEVARAEIEGFAQNLNDNDVGIVRYTQHVLASSYELLRKYDLLHLLNGIPLLPKNVVSRFDMDDCRFDMPVAGGNWGWDVDESMVDSNEHLAKSAIEKGDLYVYEDEPEMFAADCFVYANFLWNNQQDTFWMARNLHPEHWIYRHLYKGFKVGKDNKDELIRIEREREPRISLIHKDTDFHSCVKMCAAYTILSPCGRETRIEDMAVHVGWDYLLIPDKAWSSDNLLQANSYFWDETFHQDRMESEVDGFSDWLRLEREGDNAGKVIESMLHNYAGFNVLAGKSITIDFAKDLNSFAVKVDGKPIDENQKEE